MKMSGRLRYVQLARLVWRLPTYARVVWGLVRDPRTPLPLKGLLAAGLAYVAMICSRRSTTFTFGRGVDRECRSSRAASST